MALFILFRLVEVLQFRTTVLRSALNGRPVQISRGFAVSHHGSAVGETLRSLKVPAENWV